MYAGSLVAVISHVEKKLSLTTTPVRIIPLSLSQTGVTEFPGAGLLWRSVQMATEMQNNS